MLMGLVVPHKWDENLGSLASPQQHLQSYPLFLMQNDDSSYPIELE